MGGVLPARPRLHRHRAHKDVEAPGRYLVIDRWESAQAYNDFVAANREEYMRRVDDTRFLYDSELRFGTFESV